MKPLTNRQKQILIELVLKEADKYKLPNETISVSKELLEMLNKDRDYRNELLNLLKTLKT